MVQMPPDFNRDLTELLELNRECFSSIIFIAKAYVLVDCSLPLMFFITRATVLPGIPLRQSFYNQADIHGHLPAGIRGHLLTGFCDHLLGCTCDTHGPPLVYICDAPVPLLRCVCDTHDLLPA